MKKKLLCVIALMLSAMGVWADAVPYEFHASDYYAHDTGRATEVVANESTNSFEVYGKEGDGNVAFDLKHDEANGKYYITPEECWYVVEGTGLQVTKDNYKSVLWYFRGFWQGLPSYAVEKDGKQYFAWNISSRILSSENTTLSVQNDYIACTSLTSTREDHHGVITNVDYMTTAEMKETLGLFSADNILTAGKGWTKLTTAMPENAADYFYMICDTKKTSELGELAVRLGNGKDNMDKSLVYYRAAEDPVKNNAFLWTMEGFNGNNWDRQTGSNADRYLMSNLSAPFDLVYSNNTWEWNIGNNCEGWTDRGYVFPAYSIEEADWTLRNHWDNNYFGPWDGMSNMLSGDQHGRIAGNKDNDDTGHFSIYAIKKGDYLKLMGDAPVDATYLIRNSHATWKNNFHSDYPIGWTLSNEGDIKVEYGNYLSTSTDSKYFNIWQGSGNLSDRSMEQTINNLPNGTYRLRITTKDAEASQNAWLFANADETMIKGNIDSENHVYVKTKVTDGTLKIGVKLVDYQSNNLKFDEFVLTYLGASNAVVGNATVSGKVQPGETITVTYSNASDEDGGSLALGTGKVQFNGSDIDVTLTATGFTFMLPNDLTAGTDYSLVIEDNAIGYATAGVYNAEQTITLSTPAIYDGVYYLKNTASGLAKTPYLGRGKPYGTGARFTEYGAPIKTVTGENGTQLIFADALTQFKDNTDMYTDGTTDRYFTVSKTENGYLFLNHNKEGKYLSDNYGRVWAAGTTENNAYWTIETADEHIAAVKASDAAKAVTEAGKANITVESKAALETALAEYATKNITLENANKFYSSYQQNCSGDSDGAPYNIMSKTVTGLAPGLYKLTLNAFERTCNFSDVAAAGPNGMRGDCYLQAGDVKVNIIGLMEEASDVALDGDNDSKVGDNYYANSSDGAEAAFAKNMYLNTLYVYVGEGGELTYKLVIPSRYGTDGSRQRYICAQNFTLTRYYQGAEVDLATFNAKKTEVQTAYNNAKVGGTGFYSQGAKDALNTALTTANGVDTSDETAEYKEAYDALDGAYTTFKSAVQAGSAPIEGYYDITIAALHEAGRINGEGDFARAESAGSNRFEAPKYWTVESYNDNRPGLDKDPGYYTLDLERWDNGGETKNNRIYQKVTLPAGKYYFGRDLQANAKSDNIYMFASKALVETTNIKTAADVLAYQKISEGGQNEGNFYGITFTLTETSTVYLGFQADFPENQSNMRVRAVKLMSETEITDLVVNRTIAEGKYGTICVPYAATATGATIYSAQVNGNYVTLTEVNTDLVAGTPYIYKATADAQTFTASEVVKVAEPVAAGPLTGVFTETQAPVGSYVMQTKDDVQKFYLVGEGKQPTISAYKAYLNVAASPVKEYAIGGNDETAIEAINALTNGEAKIYDLNGRQLKSLQKGINIVNGVKVLVK